PSRGASGPSSRLVGTQRERQPVIAEGRSRGWGLFGDPPGAAHVDRPAVGVRAGQRLAQREPEKTRRAGLGHWSHHRRHGRKLDPRHGGGRRLLLRPPHPLRAPRRRRRPPRGGPGAPPGHPRPRRCPEDPTPPPPPPPPR